MDAKKLDNLTATEYLEIERVKQKKYEFHNGSIYAMSGGTLNHGWICGNVFGEMRTRLREKGSECRVMNSEIKLFIQSKNSYVYPDAMVICGEVKKPDTGIDAVTNPTVIVEVLSKTTESYDRGDKFFLYRQLNSLEEYLLIEQEKSQIEIYKRTGDLWSITRVTGMDQKLAITSLDIALDLTELYRDIVFEKNL